MKTYLAISVALQIYLITAVSIGEITSGKFAGVVRDIPGVVTYLGPDERVNFVIVRSTTPELSGNSSQSTFLWGIGLPLNLTVGDSIIFDGYVAWDEDLGLYLDSAQNIRLIASNVTVKPVLVGPGGRVPLDGRYGIEFWRSLNNELVLITNATILERGELGFVRGNWPSRGINSRGGLTEGYIEDNLPIFLSPFNHHLGDASLAKVGDGLTDIIGVIRAYGPGLSPGLVTIYPQANVEVKSSLLSSPPPTSLVSSHTCSGITVGDYHWSYDYRGFIPSEMNKILDHMKAPDLVFLQLESYNATETLSGVTAMLSLRSDVNYTYAHVGHGDNTPYSVHSVYLYNPAVVRLHKPNLSGPATPNEVLTSSDGRPELRYNPGIVARSNSSDIGATLSTPLDLPLIATWETVDGQNMFFTVNLVGGNHFTHVAVATAASNFISQILAVDPTARIIAAGIFRDSSDMREFQDLSRLQDLDVVKKVPKVERYTEITSGVGRKVELMAVSRGVGTGTGGFEHVHINTWSWDSPQNCDPLVAKLDVCESRGAGGVVLEPVVVDEE